MNHDGWPEAAPEQVDAQEEIDRLHRRLAEMADSDAGEVELWAVVERIRELRARL